MDFHEGHRRPHSRREETTLAGGETTGDVDDWILRPEGSTETLLIDVWNSKCVDEEVLKSGTERLFDTLR